MSSTGECARCGAGSWREVRDAHGVCGDCQRAELAALRRQMPEVVEVLGMVLADPLLAPETLARALALAVRLEIAIPGVAA